jgi:hypothetical protein
LDGYIRASGDAIHTCDVPALDSASWTGAALVCVAAVCPTFNAPNLGSVTQANRDYPSGLALFACDAGYVLSGASTRSCTVGSAGAAAWDVATAPTCGVGSCDSLDAPEFGTKVSETRIFPTGVARFSCQSGYGISNKERFCSVGVGAGVSAWTGDATKCTPCGLGSYSAGGQDAVCELCAANEVTGIEVRRTHRCCSIVDETSIDPPPLSLSLSLPPSDQSPSPPPAVHGSHVLSV